MTPVRPNDNGQPDAEPVDGDGDTPADASTIEDDEGYFADVGFMFEGHQPTRVQYFCWTIPTRTTTKASASTPQPPHQQQPQRTIRLSVRVVDDDPGAVQSGHYLWPAARLLADHLVQASSSSSQEQQQPRTLVELGAGCALLSCLALQLWQPSLECLVVTDHDPGTLERARDNYESTLQTLLDAASQLSQDDDNDDALNDAINRTASIHAAFERLSWGNAADSKAVRQLLGEHNSRHVRRADVIVGSDLIYDTAVVEPLLRTARDLLAADGVFILSQSFAYEEATEESIDASCTALGLERTIVMDQERGKLRIQEFRLVEKLDCSISSFTEDGTTSPT
jgi:predicted nicotinamide N-methyase